MKLHRLVDKSGEIFYINIKHISCLKVDNRIVVIGGGFITLDKIEWNHLIDALGIPT